MKSPVENQRKITFFLGQTDESNQDSTEDIATTGNSDNTSDTPVELWKFQDRWCSLFSWVTYESKENKMFCQSAIIFILIEVILAVLIGKEMF